MKNELMGTDEDIDLTISIMEMEVDTVAKEVEYLKMVFDELDMEEDPSDENVDTYQDVDVEEDFGEEEQKQIVEEEHLTASESEHTEQENSDVTKEEREIVDE